MYVHLQNSLLDFAAASLFLQWLEVAYKVRLSVNVVKMLVYVYSPVNTAVPTRMINSIHGEAIMCYF